MTGANDRTTGAVNTIPTRKTFRAAHRGFFHASVIDVSKIYTANHRAHTRKGIERARVSVRHGVQGYVNGQARTDDTGSFGAGLKRGYQGTLNNMDKMHLHRHAGDLTGRHSVVVDLVGKRPCLADPAGRM